MAVNWSEPSRALSSARRLDPEFFDPRVTKVADAVSSFGAVPITEWVSGAARGVSPAYDSSGNTRVIKTAHVHRVELLDAPEEFVAVGTEARGVIPIPSLLITSTGV